MTKDKTKKELLKKIKELELLVLLDGPKPPTEAEKFDKWVEVLQGRCREIWDVCSFNQTHNPERYAKYRTIKAMVDQLYQDKFGNSKEYHKNKPEIRKMIANIVAMTMFYEEEWRV